MWLVWNGKLRSYRPSPRYVEMSRNLLTQEMSSPPFGSSKTVRLYIQRAHPWRPFEKCFRCLHVILTTLPAIMYLKTKKFTPLDSDNRWPIKTPWPDSASELYRPRQAKLVPTFSDRVCLVVSMTDPYGSVLGFLDRSRYFFFQVTPQLYSRSWVDPVPDPLLLRKSERRISNPDLWIWLWTLTTIPQRRSTFFNITYIISVRTSQEAQYISDLYSGTLTTRPQRRSTFFYITYINSVRTSQEAQYISVV
jgi:hypothetical protein